MLCVTHISDQRVIGQLVHMVKYMLSDVGPHMCELGAAVAEEAFNANIVVCPGGRCLCVELNYGKTSGTYHRGRDLAKI